MRLTLTAQNILYNVYMYSIHGAIVHQGSTVNIGHYVTYLKQDGSWFLHNDDKPTQKVELKQIDNRQTYVLIAKKCEAEGQRVIDWPDLETSWRPKLLGANRMREETKSGSELSSSAYYYHHQSWCSSPAKCCNLKYMNPMQIYSVKSSYRSKGKGSKTPDTETFFPVGFREPTFR